jgi:hypothetical protein
MRRAAMLVLLALLAVAMVSAQTPAAPGNNSSSTPQTQAAPAQNGSAAGSSSQSPDQNQPANPGQTTSPSSVQNSTAAGQDAANANPAAGSDQIPAGTELHATLDTPLSTKISKPGDRFTATVNDPVRGSNGTVVVPAGARIEGEVADADEGKTLAALRGKGKLSLRFRDVVLPTGQTLPLSATLVSVNDTNGKNTKKADEEGQVRSGARGKDVAKDVGIGAGIGTVAGLAFGGPLKGLAIGALAGGGYVLATKGKDVNLPAQTGMVIRLDEPFTANGSTAPLLRR